MEITAIQTFAIVQGIITTIASLVFVVFMIKNFIRKKTTGTALLTIFYGLFSLAQGSNLIYNVYSLFKPLVIGHKISIIIYIASLILSNVMLYVFASRNIFKDNDIVRMLNIMILIIIPTTFFGMFSYEILREIAEPLFVSIGYQPGTGFLQYNPTMLMGLVVYSSFVILVHLRLILTMSLDLLRKKIKAPLKKRGWELILYAIVALIIGVFLTTALFTIKGIALGIVIALYIVKGVFIVLGLLFSYLGWILPTWLRNRIREKTWLAKNLKNIGQSSARFVTSQTYLEETKITEYSE